MFHFQNKIIIGGRYLSSSTGKVTEATSPRTGKVITSIPYCDENELNLAVISSRKAFDRGIWREISPSAKKNILLKFASLVEQNSKELAYIESIDTGKPIYFSKNIDLPITVECIRWYAENLDKLENKYIGLSAKEKALIERVPVGIVAAIVPWNFPLYICCLKIIPALISGNSVIVKPSEKASLSILRLVELLHISGLPKGVCNVITGDSKLGKLIGLCNEIDCISFTGSTDIGKQFLHYSSESNMKKVSLECGGKSPCIITENYKNLRDAAKQVAFNVFFNQGAVCGGPNRVIVHSSIKNQFCDFLIKEAQNFIPNDPSKNSTRMGAIIDNDHAEKILTIVQDAIRSGCKLIAGGKTIDLQIGGIYIEPTILDITDTKSQIAKQEVFGPVITIEQIDSTEEIIEKVNSSKYGLSASVFCNDIKAGLSLCNRLRVGIVSLNKVSDGDIRIPFGGFRQSGIGRDRSMESINNYTEVKATLIDIDK